MASLLSVGGAPRKVGSNTTQAKKVVLEVFQHLDWVYNGVQSTDGCLIIMIPYAQLEKRNDPDKDKTLGIFSGLIAKDPANHPKYEAALKQCITPNRTFQYERPSSSDNRTSATWVTETATGPKTVPIPATWALQVYGTSLAEALNMTKDIFDKALIGDGWNFDAANKRFNKTVQNKTGTNWSDVLQFWLAPRGTYDDDDIKVMEQFLGTLPNCFTIDGRAACRGTSPSTSKILGPLFMAENEGAGCWV